METKKKIIIQSKVKAIPTEEVIRDGTSVNFHPYRAHFWGSSPSRDQGKSHPFLLLFLRVEFEIRAVRN